MFGKYFLIIYVIVQTAISILTEYVIWRNRFYKKIGSRTRVPRIIVYSLLAAFPVLGAFMPKCSLKYFCMGIGNIWLGFLMYYSGFIIIISAVCHIICCLLGDDEKKIPEHILNISLVMATAVTVYGLVHAQNPKLLDYDININKKTESVKELKVVLIADLHLSVNSFVGTTERMVEEVNSVNPDLILVAGDIFTSNYDGLRNPEKYSEALRKMQSRYGVYTVCGNHDVDENLFGGFSVSPVSEAFRIPDMDAFFEDAGFTVLQDESIEIADGEVILSGRIDGEKAGNGTNLRMSARELLGPVDKTKPVIVLQHEPTEFEDLSENGADVVMCGHTHNGQIFPGNLIIPFFNENAYGLKKLYGIDTIVTAGVGYYGPPLRVGTDSEVTVVNIRFTG